MKISTLLLATGVAATTVLSADSFAISFHSLADAVRAHGHCSKVDSKLDPATRTALIEALQDERKAQQRYAAIMERFGEVLPFANIIRAEERHEAHLLQLFEAYEVDVPPRTPKATEPAVPATFTAACQAAARLEIENVAMYDRFLEFIDQPDIRNTMQRLRAASLERHLPAFERAAGRGGQGRSGESGPRAGQGRFQGQGQGQGPGRGGPGCCGGRR